MTTSAVAPTISPPPVVLCAIDPADRGKIVESVTISWAELAHEIENPQTLKAKDAAPLVIGATFRDGGRRCSADLVSRDVVALDFDRVPDVDAFVEAWRARGLRAIVHTTWSHPNDDGTGRLRVFVALSRGVDVAEWNARVKPWMRSLDGAEVDEKALDAVRISHCWSARPGYASWSLDGAPLDVDSLPAAPEREATRPAGPLAVLHRSDLPSHLTPSVEAVAAALRDECPTAGKRNEIAGDLAAVLASDAANFPRGLPFRPFVAAFVERACALAGFDVENKREWIRRSVDRVVAGDVATGWPTMRERHPILAAAIDSIKRPELESFARMTSRAVAANDAAGADRDDAVAPANDPESDDAGPAADPFDRLLPLLQRGDHVELAKELIATSPRELVTDEGAIWEYDPERGVWTSDGVEKSLRLRVADWAGRPVISGEKTRPLKIGSPELKGTIEVVRLLTEKRDFFAGAPFGIACVNGFVTLDGVIAHARENRARTYYNLAFDAGARSEPWEKFLVDLFRDDPDKAEKIACVQEFFGGALFGIASQHDKCLMGTGKNGDNGKSTLGEIIRAVFPSNKVQAIPPRKWGERFALAELVGTLLNVVGELPSGGILDSQHFKDIVAGDLVQTERKHEQSFAFRPIAGHYFACNKLPATNDQSGGFWRRFLVIEFNRNFKGDPQRETGIAERILATERAGILAWLVAGARRLVAKDGYTIPASHERALRAWQTNTCNVKLWLEACEGKIEGAAAADAKPIPARPAYCAYQHWAVGGGYKVVAENNFKARMGDCGYRWEHTRAGSVYHRPVPR